MSSGLTFAIVALVALLTLFFASRYFRLAIYWGALWGITAGFWLVAPRMIQAHYLIPTSAKHWLVLDAFFIVVFVPLGVLLAAASTWPFAAFWHVRKTVFRDADLAAGFWTAVTVPCGYVLLAAWIEWTNFARPPVSNERQLLPVVVATCIALALVLRLVYRSGPARAGAIRGSRLRRLVAAMGVAGIFALVFSVPALPGAKTSVEEALTRRAGSPSRAPLLVIGLDGGNWATLDPLIRQQTVPTLSALAAQGIRGEVEALWPPYWSGPAWGAILTGHTQSEIGVHEDLTASAPGLPSFELPLALSLPLDPMFAVEFQLIRSGIVRPMPMPRDRLHRSPIWERLTPAGVKTAVIRFPFTYPATGQASVVVSNLVSTDLWEMAGVSSSFDADLVSPPARSPQILGLFSAPHPQTPGAFRQIFPEDARHRAADALVDPLDVLRKMIDINEKTFQVARQIVEEEQDIDIVMLHLGSFDNICHAFWQYRFPEQFPSRNRPRPEDVRMLGPVIDRYLMYLDAHLKRIISAFPTPPNVLVVADHGQEASPDYPLWKGWHSRFGVFLAAGPDIPSKPGQVAVSYFDVVPTILDLLGFNQPSDLAGRSIVRPVQ